MGEPAPYGQAMGKPRQDLRGRPVARVTVEAGGLVTLTPQVLALLGISGGDYVHLKPAAGGIELHRIDLRTATGARTPCSPATPPGCENGGSPAGEPPPLPSTRPGHLPLRPASSSSSSSSSSS